MSKVSRKALVTTFPVELGSTVSGKLTLIAGSLLTIRLEILSPCMFGVFGNPALAVPTFWLVISTVWPAVNSSKVAFQLPDRRELALSRL